MAQVVWPDQTYCIPGRLIYDNIVLIRDLLEISKLFGLKMGIVSIDQEKAFDRVEHTYLWGLFQLTRRKPSTVLNTHIYGKQCVLLVLLLVLSVRLRL